MACIYCALMVVVEAVMWSQKAKLQVPVLKAFFISNYSWFVVVITEFWSQNGYLQFRFLRPHHRFNYNQECTINTSHLKNLGSYFIARLIIYFINVYALCIIIMIQLHKIYSNCISITKYQLPLSRPQNTKYFKCI